MAMERDAVSLGFQRDKGKSRTNYPVFSKVITEDWHLCWSVKDGRRFFDGYFDPILELRSRDFGGKLAKDAGAFLPIRYAIVPGFGNGYWVFITLDELEIAIRAHLHLYSLMAPIIEAGILKVLRETPPS
jgi:hypothetical protein